tara:strand:- start:960 stop:1190 length:231 start_codon:yes stop_codon:yes gene_type:complete
MSSNAAKLYEQISNNPEQTQALFRQALQDPSGAMLAICKLGQELGLPVTAEEVKAHLASVDDADTSRWVVKARGGL